MKSRRSLSARFVPVCVAVGAVVATAGFFALSGGLTGFEQASASVAPTRIRDALSGVGYADRTDWANWRGQPVAVSETWNDAKDSSGTLTWIQMNQLYTVKEYYSNGKWSGALSLAQPMYEQSENVNSCASTTAINTWLDQLKAAWSGNTYIRLGWEFNGDWYSWKQGRGDATAFKNCWMKWYDLVKGANPDYKLVFNPNFESSDAALNVTDFWPGAEYVDAAGPDNYARNDNGVLRSPDKTGSHGEPIGIYAWQQWVAQKGVPFAVPEWGINDKDAWGSIDPEFITQMRTAFQRAAQSPSGLAYESYFDGSTAFDCKFSLHDSACGYDVHQVQADRYKSLWNQPYNTDTVPTTPTTPPPTGDNRLLVGVASNRCLTLPASDGQTATIQDCAGQRWTLSSSGALISGGKCLDVWDHGTGDGALVSSWSCSGLANQKWQVNADGTIVGTESGRCLDVNGELTAAGTKVQLWSCTGGSNQRWSWQQ